MSVDKSTYGIIGYDLTDIKDTLLNEVVCESDWYENLRNNQREGHIQAFDDPMSGDYLYFGYIFFECGDEYRNAMSSISLSDIEQAKKEVEMSFNKHFGLDLKEEPKVLVFHEYT